MKQFKFMNKLLEHLKH